ncbi:HepT-like ribonuclease domain-containing protein [Geminocystis herdmanii]|uniref:HepT-like ribonuclease domain-containing protein n=1 Tax=Geminocystis herdmanii TaxID=669359 RepID=UPI000345BCB2|nr:DUF86 domain-containing protein [Geminocystis herdmanii]
MSRTLKLYLEDIDNCIDKINKYIKNISQIEFLGNELIYDAVIRNLQIIGEATKNIPDTIRIKYPHIDWRSIIGLRNIIVHAYFSIDDDILWNTIKIDLFSLQECIKIITKTENLDIK